MAGGVANTVCYSSDSSPTFLPFGTLFIPLSHSHLIVLCLMSGRTRSGAHNDVG
jgi:hypothetical protein